MRIVDVFGYTTVVFDNPYIFGAAVFAIFGLGYATGSFTSWLRNRGL